MNTLSPSNGIPEQMHTNLPMNVPMAMAHAPGQPVQPLQYCMTNQPVQPISFATPIQQQHQQIGFGLQPSPVENQNLQQAFQNNMNAFNLVDIQETLVRLESKIQNVDLKMEKLTVIEQKTRATAITGGKSTLNTCYRTI